MNPQSLMDIVYPVLSGVLLVYGVLLLLTYLFVERTAVLLPLSIYFIVAAATAATLAVLTGDAPLLSIDQFRVIVVWERISMIPVLLVCIWLQARRIRKGR